MRSDFKIIVVTLFPLLLLCNCTAFKKEIKKEVAIAIPDTLFMAEISSTAINNKYTSAITSAQVLTSFLKGFKQEGKNTPNVVLSFNADNADFILKCRYLKVEETSTIQVISDPKSAYNGKEVVLNRVAVSAEFDLTDTKDPGRRITSCSNQKERTESETNNRNLEDLISGSNKDKSQYRTKLLKDDIALSLSEDVGRRIWVPISRRIAKTQK